MPPDEDAMEQLAGLTNVAFRLPALLPGNHSFYSNDIV